MSIKNLGLGLGLSTVIGCASLDQKPDITVATEEKSSVSCTFTSVNGEALSIIDGYLVSPGGRYPGQDDMVTVREECDGERRYFTNEDDGKTFRITDKSLIAKIDVLLEWQGK